MKMAIYETNAYLGEAVGLDFNHAFALSIIAVDCHITQVVDGTNGIHAMIPKNLFIDHKLAEWPPRNRTD